MKRYYLLIIGAVLLLIAINVFFYRSYYKIQISHQRNMLLQQTEVCSNEIERVVQKFESDLNYILFSDDISNLFTEKNSDGLRKLQLFYSTYTNLVKNIDIYDNNKNVLNLFRDSKKNFITDSYLAQRQRELSLKEEVLMHNSEYQYVLPVFKDNQIFANILITINLKDYILSELEKFHLKNYTIQWVIDLDNKNISNVEKIDYTRFEGKDEMVQNLEKDLEGLLIHNIGNDTIDIKLLSVYSPLKVLGKKFGVAMSIDHDACMDKTFTKLVYIGLFSILIFILVSIFFVSQIMGLKKKIKL